MQDSVGNVNNDCSEGKSSSISSTDSGIAIETMDTNCQEIGNTEKNINADFKAVKKSPALSIRSTVISINSIESSVIDSDSEEEDLDGLIVRKLGEQQDLPEGSVDLVQSAVKGGVLLSQIVDNGGIISQTTAGPRTQIGSLQVDRSNKVTIGDQHIFRGPTTVNLIVPPSHKLSNGDKNGNVNGAFDGAYDGIYNNNPDKKQSNTSDPTGKDATIKTVSKFKKPKTLLTALVVAVIAILLFVTGILVWTTQSQSQDNIGSGLVLRQVTRDEWVAQPAKTTLEKLVLPVSRVVIAHTATEGCKFQSACVFRVRYIQSFHMDSKGWDDIAYNFLIGDDGNVYEGRGWDNQGAHTKGYNRDSVGIAFIGTFTSTVPNNKSLNVYNLLIDEGIRLGKLKKDYKVYGTRQLNGSESPGQKFYDIIRTWSHWSDKI